MDGEIVAVHTATCAPVIVATRLRKCSAGSGKHGGHRLAQQSRRGRWGITAQVAVRADSAYFSHKAVDVCRKADAWFWLAVVVKKTIREAVAGIAKTTWTSIRYAAAIWDEEERWISDSEIAEVPLPRVHQ
ncbi:hypothetical protein [Streptomyces thermodiastaticus]|uniref:hypothetical protein n=1 Tax=Streptomyces thermodiastaticus TaxID=44061 RepID=UPI001679E6FE|nr:hypothetical protein [Streptomyces thermodiastaticus]MCE7550296.1 hypothetical protein [Streptomyces thermodiastaticus]GHF91072.1 hypothetical protein GCM10018787_44840 [Streptomyces thermodiastaticus]